MEQWEYIGVSIHVNSVEKGNPSGTEGWHTVGGFDDERSKTLAAMLAKAISNRFGIINRGIKPETAYPEGLYIHHWWNIRRCRGVSAGSLDSCR
jgi:hypothetical protein